MRPLATLALLLALAACVRPAEPPPLLDLGARACPGTPDLAAAPTLVVTSPATNLREFDITAASPCLRGPDGPGLYAAFLLPSLASPAMLRVASIPQGPALFAPRIQLLDRAGQVLREVGPDAFLFRGGGLTALVRLRDGEAAVVITSHPPVIGQDVSRIQSATHATPMIGPGVAFVVYTGSEAAQRQVLSHNGRVVIALSAVPTGQ